MSTNVYAYLNISGFTCAPEEVTALVGLPAERIRLIGECTRRGRLIDRDNWSSCPVVPSNEDQPDHHVAAVLQHIESQPRELVAFLRCHDSGINCVGEFRRSINRPKSSANRSRESHRVESKATKRFSAAFQRPMQEIRRWHAIDLWI